MLGFIRSAAVVFVAVALSGGSVLAQLDSDQAACQSTVAKKGRVYAKKSFKALAKCYDAVGKGELAPSTDCRLDPDASDKIAKAVQKYRDKVIEKCPDALLALSGDGLDFGGNCHGETTATVLADCLVAEHDSSVDSIISLVYKGSTGKKCGKNGTGLGCNSAANCPATIPCTIPIAHRQCRSKMGKALSKYTNKRLSLIQKCKKSVAKGQLPPGTDCLATAASDLAALEADTIADIQADCPANVATPANFGGGCRAAGAPDQLAACAVCVDEQQTDALLTVQHGNLPKPNSNAVALQITDANDPVTGCVKGPLSRCRVNDFLLRNNKIRVIIQDAAPNTPIAGTTGRSTSAIGEYGGNIIDADIVRTSGPDRDNFEEWAISLNVETTAHYTSIAVMNDGSDGAPAVIRATGVDDLLDTINPSSVVADFGFLFPASANDVDLPVGIITDYILEPDTNWVRVESTVQNLSGAAFDFFFGEYMNGSGQVELFQGVYGFGEPLVITACAPDAPNLCDYVAYSGEDEADGVSYGYVQTIPNTTTFTTSGVTVPQLGASILLVLLGQADPNFTVEPLNQPGDSMTFTRYFVVGDKQVSSITDARNQIRCIPTGTLQGTVTLGGSPQAGIDVTILGPDAQGTAALDRNIVTYTRTDASGNYSLTLPPGTYQVAANSDGAPYEGGGSTPTEHTVAITFGGTTMQNIALPATGAIQVLVEDENGDPIGARASVVGFDPSPDPRNNQNILAVVNNRMGWFGDRSEDFPAFGIAKSIFIDPSGDSGVQPLEPGNYEVVVSHGPEYSIDRVPITVTAGSTSVVNAVVERVLDTRGFISADFHVHSIDSADCEVSRAERVVSMIAEGMDFFTPSDHEFRIDFAPTLTALGVTDLISIATSSEITTFDYGHFNAWPMTYDPSKVNGGAIDHGGAAPDGEDFPSSGYYNEAPVDIIAAAHADPGTDTVQINHFYSHFGLDGGSGLAIDTGEEPPQSYCPPEARRLNPAISNLFTDTFDALEIWIGDDRGQIFNNFLGQSAGDWFNLINQGIVRTGISNSDTHSRHTGISGLPRNMIASLEDDPGELGPLADALSSTVNDGRVFGTNGPMVRITSHAASTNQSGGLDRGRCTDGVTPCTNTTTCPPCTDDSDCSIGLTCEELPLEIATSNGAVDITVDIQSAEWAPFDEVEFYVNSTTTRSIEGPQETGAGEITYNRYSITPDFSVAPTMSLQPVAGTSSNRWEGRATLTLTGLIDDVWVVAMVKGNDGVSEPLYPVVPNSLNQNTNTTLADLTDGNLGELGMTALAVTNPIFVDVNGGGWTAPGVQINP